MLKATNLQHRSRGEVPMCRRLIAVVVGAVAVCGIASAQPGYPGGYGGLGASAAMAGEAVTGSVAPGSG